MRDARADIPDREKGSVVVIENIFEKLIEWVWAPFLGALIWVYLKLDEKIYLLRQRHVESHNENDKRLTVLEQHYINIGDRISALDDRRREDRQEIMSRIDGHSQTMYVKIDKLNEKLDQIISG